MPTKAWGQPDRCHGTYRTNTEGGQTSCQSLIQIILFSESTATPRAHSAMSKARPNPYILVIVAL